jgi:type I restriction enzyme S subunit
MASEWREASVATLVREGVLFVEDGNHGEYRPLAEEFTDTGTPFVRPDDLRGGRVDFANCDRINDQALNRVRKGKGRAGDIVFTHRATVGRIARTGPDAPNFVANPGVTVWRAIAPGVLDPDYLYFFMQSSIFMNQVWAEAGNTDTFPYVSLTQQRCLEVSFPSIGQQRAIAHILGALDDKIELNRRMSETLEAMARALFQSWFVDFDPVRAKAEGRDPGLPKPLADLFPARLVDSELGEIPEGWEVGPLPSVIDVNPPRSLHSGCVAPYLDMANMPTRGHAPDGVVDREFGSGMRFTNGDTLVARITPCLENGKTAFVDFLEEGQIGWGSTEYIVMRPKPPLPEEFAYCLARGGEFREFAIQSMTGSSGRQRVPVESLHHFRLAMAPRAIAEEFGRRVRPLFSRSSTAVTESRTVAALRDALLPKLISGDLRVKETERFEGFTARA